MTQENIHIVSLYSSSSGNSTYISLDGHEILIDAGGTYKAITSALENIGTSPENITDIFITHEHEDHVSSLKTMLKKISPRVHVSADSAREIYRREPALSGMLCEHSPIYEVSFGTFKVSSFTLSHDSAVCLGYIVEKDGEKLFGSATDTGYISDDALRTLSGCRYALCEANHDIDMLLYGTYPPFVKERILSNVGHLSNFACASLVRQLMECGSERIMLSHLSEKSNTPERAFSEIVSACPEGCADRIRIASAKHSEVLV